MATGPSSFSAPDDNDRVSESLSIIEASSVEAVPITRQESKVHVRHYPYCAVGTLFAYFPDNKDTVYHSTCFLIEANVVVTLASNLYNVDQGGKATSVTTSFSNEKVTTIMFPDNFEKNKLSGSNLAVLLYSNQVVSDWLGVKIASQEELSDKDILVMASLGPKNESNKSVLSGDSLSQNDSSSNEGAPVGPNASTTSIGGTTSIPQEENKYAIKYINNSDIHEISNSLNGKMSVETNDEKLLKKCIGGPVYYKGYDGGPYVIGFLDKSYCVQQIDTESFQFLVKCVNEGKKMRKKVHKNIEEDKIYKERRS